MHAAVYVSAFPHLHGKEPVNLRGIIAHFSRIKGHFAKH